jgi:CBS domain containing-hemolysin-like protein
LKMLPPIVHTGPWYSLTPALAFSTITFLQVVAGQLSPGPFIWQSPEKTCLSIALPTLITRLLFKPLIGLRDRAGNAWRRVAGVCPAASGELVHAPQDLKMPFRASTARSVVDRDGEDLLRAVFPVKDTPARRVMLPPKGWGAGPDHACQPKIIGRGMDHHPISMSPVDGGSPDLGIGVAHRKDPLGCQYQPEQPPLRACSLTGETLDVTLTAHLNHRPHRVGAPRRHSGVVLDEYGSTAGVAIVDAMLKEIVGGLCPSFDHEVEIEPLSDGIALPDGSARIEDANNHTGLRRAHPGYDAAGFPLGRLGRLIQALDAVAAGGLDVPVGAMGGQLISRLSRSRLAERPADG